MLYLSNLHASELEEQRGRALSSTFLPHAFTQRGAHAARHTRTFPPARIVARPAGQFNRTWPAELVRVGPE
eukprot:765325-Hanusia_phi.AAC.3